MVDSISGSGSVPGIKRLADDATIKSTRSTAAATGNSGAAADIKTTATEMPQEFAKSPPIELETVTRIQKEIAEGNYPIDIDAITESLFESYLELQS